MAEWISEPIGSAATNVDPSSNAPSSTFERVDPLEMSKQIGRFVQNSAASSGVVDPDTGEQTITPEATISPEDAMAKYGLGGKLKYDAPIPESVAQRNMEAKIDEMKREDAAQRSPGGIGTTATDFAAGMLDPVGIAASFIPVVGEARMAGVLGRAGLSGLERVATGAGSEAIDGIAGRTAFRALTGTVDAGIMNAPLVGARLGMSQQEQADYSSMDALKDLAMGAAVGGVIHGGVIGPIRDAVGYAFGKSPGGMIAAENPEAHEAATRAAVAAVAEDRPVDVGPLMEIHAAQAAEDDLTRLQGYHASVDAETDAARSGADMTDQISAAQDRLKSVTDEADGVSGELKAAQDGGAQSPELADAQANVDRTAGLSDDAQERARFASMDPVTQARLTSIDADLSSNQINKGRRADLEAQRQMLVDGRPFMRDLAQRAQTDPEAASALQALADASADHKDASARLAEAAGLEKARSDSQVQALTAVSDAARSRVDAAEADLARVLNTAQDNGRISRITENRNAGRQAVAEATATRTIKKAAGGLGYQIADKDARDLAQSVLRREMTPGEAMDAVRSFKDGSAPIAKADGSLPTVQERVASIRGDRDAAMKDLMKSEAVRRATGGEDPAAVQAMNDAMQPREAVKPEARATDADAFVKSADDAGVIDEASRAELDHAEAEAAQAPSLIEAIKQAAACILRGGV